VDATFPGETTKGIADQIKKARPTRDHSVNSSRARPSRVNTKRPPFDNAKVRDA